MTWRDTPIHCSDGGSSIRYGLASRPAARFTTMSAPFATASLMKRSKSTVRATNDQALHPVRRVGDVPQSAHER